MHEFSKDPFEVGEGIHAVTTDLFNKGIDHGTTPTCVFVPDKHPVLCAQLCGPDGPFGVVVVELDLTVLEARFKVAPLVEGVVKRFPKVTLGQDAAVFLKMFEEFFEMMVCAT